MAENSVFPGQRPTQSQYGMRLATGGVARPHGVGQSMNAAGGGPPGLANRDGGLPPGLAKRENGLPPGLAKRENGLPPGLANRAGGLPPGLMKQQDPQDMRRATDPQRQVSEAASVTAGAPSVVPAPVRPVTIPTGNAGMAGTLGAAQVPPIDPAVAAQLKAALAAKLSASMGLLVGGGTLPTVNQVAPPLPPINPMINQTAPQKYIPPQPSVGVLESGTGGARF